MPNQAATTEDQVRHLTMLGLSTRRIARELQRLGTNISPSTVWRTQQKINTGPNPILTEDADHQRRRSWPAAHPVTVLVAALLLIALILAPVIWVRYLRAPAVPVQVTACVEYSAAGDVTGLAGGGSCPPGWKAIILVPRP